MRFRLSGTRVYAVGLFLLLAALAPAAGLASPPRDFTPLAVPCVSGPTNLCLNSQRFKLEVQWKDFQGNTGAGQAVPLTSDTGYFWFFSSNNVELVVKVLDGRGLNGHFWVFYGALSNVEYTMHVTDSVTGNVKTYFNPSGQFASVGDTEAFSASGTVQPSQRSGVVYRGSKFPVPFRPSRATESHTLIQATSTCVSTETALCLNGGRFRVEVSWKDFQGNTGVGKAIPLTSDTGYFWFFNSANVELVLKALDARVINNRFWVFYGALSNVEYDITVTDTSNGDVRRYRNPAHRFASTGDTQAFPPDQSPAIGLARGLAESVLQAKNHEERQQALLEILQALNVGVYTSSGRAVLHGAERGPGDFYLYEFEVQMMSQSLERGDTWGIADLTFFLNEMGILPPEVELQPEELRQILLDGTRSAVQDPDDPLSLAALLNRELGLRRSTPYDAAVAMDMPSTRFDALQQFLILADLTLPIVREQGPVTGASRLAIQSGGILRQGTVSPQNTCEEIANVLKVEWGFGKAFRFLLKYASIPAKAAATIIDAIHGPIIALGVEVKELDSVLRTHYGHESEGKELQFRILVHMRDELPENLINCGWLAGVEFPRKGPIQGVTVVWLHGELQKHGELSCDSIVCTSSTGADGVATLVFQPMSEEEPGEGSVIEETGLVEGIALYQSRLRNSIGTVAQILTPKSGTTRWFVEYHAARVTFVNNETSDDEGCWMGSIDITVLFVPLGANVSASSSWGATDSKTGDATGTAKLSLPTPRHCPCLSGSFTVRLDGNQIFSDSSDCY